MGSGWGWRAERDRRWVVLVRVGVGRAGDVRRGECRRWIEALARAREMSLGEEGVLGLGGETGQGREVRVRSRGVRIARRGRCRLGRAND